MKHLINKLNYRRSLAGSSNPIELKTNILTILQQLGLTDFSLINTHCHNIAQTTLNTYPHDLIVSYHNNKYYLDDAILQYAALSKKPFHSSSIFNYLSLAPFSSRQTITMNKINELFYFYKYYDQYNMTYHSNNASYLFSLSCKGEKPIEFINNINIRYPQLCEILNSIIYVLENKFENLLPKKEKTTIRTKPLRVLSMLANSDFTISQVAKALNISEVTASQHLKTVRNALKVKTNYAAIKKAVLSNQLELSDPRSVSTTPDNQATIYEKR